MNPEATLFLDIFVAGALSFGGLAAVLSSLQNSVVSQHHLTTPEEFARTYSLGVGAPGPNAIFLSLLGYRLGGARGAVLAALAWALPTLFMLYLVGRTGSEAAPKWMKSARKALVPITAGLLAAGALSTARSFALPVPQWVITLLALAVLLKKPKWNPIWVVAGCALLGAISLR